jgi:hypothetical protein
MQLYIDSCFVNRHIVQEIQFASESQGDTVPTLCRHRHCRRIDAELRVEIPCRKSATLPCGLAEEWRKTIMEHTVRTMDRCTRKLLCFAPVVSMFYPMRNLNGDQSRIMSARSVTAAHSNAYLATVAS